MADEETMRVYAAQAEVYATKFPGGDDPHLERFLDVLPKGARILDLGCGPGKAAARMMARGFAALAWDASPEFVAWARDTYGVQAEVAEFSALDGLAEFDAIYANFSLLHAPKGQMPAHLARIATALTPGGRFHVGTKTGTGEKRDALGRFYAYYEDAELTGLLEHAGFIVDYRKTGAETGLDGTRAPWIILQAIKND
ncbi:MAG: class I SAM-dependent methyltransferase [Pseudomonadota bacterium]